MFSIIYNISLITSIDVPQPLCNDLWVFLLQKFDAECKICQPETIFSRTVYSHALKPFADLYHHIQITFSRNQNKQGLTYYLNHLLCRLSSLISPQRVYGKQILLQQTCNVYLHLSPFVTNQSQALKSGLHNRKSALLQHVTIMYRCSTTSE